MRSKFDRCLRAAGVFLALCLPLFCLLAGTGEAARHQAVHELNYFKSYETEVDGRQALRIEIGMNRDNLQYTVTTKPYLRKQLIIDLQNTVPGELKQDIRLAGERAARLTIKELERRHTQVAIDCGQAVEEGSYAVHVEKADRKARKPYRLVIDIFADARAGSSTVKGIKGRSIVLDPGHGGSDTGAIGPSGVTEKAVTLAVSQRLAKVLESSGARVTMTRDTDVDVYGRNATDRQELQARVNVGEYTPGADIFVSIHCNAFSSPSAHGMETYYFAGSRRGQQLAGCINEELEKAGGLLNRGNKTANFYVLKHSSMPATLLELAFVTNPREESLLSDSNYQQTLAEAIARGISRYFGE